MFYSKEVFAAYGTVAVEKAFGIDGFRGGDVGLTVGELRSLPGMGAESLTTLADVLGIEDKTVVLKFIVNSDYEVEYSVPPAFRRGKEEDTPVLVFNMGDFSVDVKTLSKFINKTFKDANGYGSFSVKTITIGEGTPNAKEVGCYLFNLTKPATTDEAGNPNPVEKVEYEFAVAPNRKIETAQQDIVSIMKKGTFTEILNALISSESVGKLYTGNGYQIELKHLPLGLYEVSQIDRIDKVIKKKDGTSAPIKGWSFEAFNVTTRETFNVKTYDSSFLGQAICGAGFSKAVKLTDPELMKKIREALDAKAAGKTDAETLAIFNDTPMILREASVGRPGKIAMLLKEHKVLGENKISPQGQVATNVDAALKAWSKLLQDILQKEAQKQLSAAPAAEATINVAPIKELQPA